MDLGLKGRVAAIMGGSAGIGKAIAAGLAAEGANVVLIARDPDNLEGAAKEITDRWPVEVLTQPADNTKTDTMNAAAAAAAERFGTVDILVNNAGQRMRRMDWQILWEDEDWMSDVDAKTIGILISCDLDAVAPQAANEDGAAAVALPSEAAAAAEVVITMLHHPQPTTAASYDERGVLAGLQPGALWIEMSTTHPATTLELAQAAEERQAALLDAPFPLEESARVSAACMPTSAPTSTRRPT